MFELRFSPTLEANDSGKLVGYAAVFNSRSHDLGGFVEVIAPDAFNRTLKEFPDVLALIEHDTNRVLARTTNGTLHIAPDAHGLRIEIDPADTSYARDYTTLVKRGDVAGMSFRFRPFAGGDSWDRSGAIPVRTLKSVQLKEVSIVVDPAYPATEVSLRSLPDTTQQALRSLRLRLAAL
jgi:HK97 family phage prohead protease